MLPQIIFKLCQSYFLVNFDIMFMLFSNIFILCYKFTQKFEPKRTYEHTKCIKFKTNFSIVKYLKLDRSENNIVKLLNYIGRLSVNDNTAKVLIFHQPV